MSNSRKKLESSKKFQNWIRNLKNNKIQLEEYKILHLVERKNGEVLFAFLEANMKTPDGQKLPPIVVLRGHFVAILPHLIASDSRNEYALLVKQRRVATGGYFYEFPAGMCDEEENPQAVAIQELKEECGIEAHPEQLIQLNSEPIYSSPGLLDEGGYFFAIQLFLPENQILKLNHQHHGLHSDSEFITTKIINFADAKQYITNTHGFTLLYLYSTYLQSNPPVFP